MSELLRDFEGESPVIRFGHARLTSVTELLAAISLNNEPPFLAVLAQAVNHLVQGTAFRVILDPKKFADDYRHRYEHSDALDQPRELGQQIALYALPALDQLVAPRMEGRTLIYCAENRALGFPYRVEVDLDAPAEKVNYQPLPTQ